MEACDDPLRPNLAHSRAHRVGGLHILNRNVRACQSLLVAHLRRESFGCIVGAQLIAGAKTVNGDCARVPRAHAEGQDSD